MKVARLHLAFAVVISVALAPLAAAAEPEESWQFGASIYGWFPDIAGRTAFSDTTGGGEFEVDVGDILDNLEMVFMGTFDARRGRWGVWTDAIYMDLGASQTGTRNGTVGGLPIPTDASADVDLDMKSWIWTLAGYFRGIDNPRYTFDTLVGLRYLDVDQKVDWDVTGNVGSIPIEDRSGSARADLKNWDAIVGIRGRFAFGANHAWFVPYYFDVGAGDSDLTWQVLGGLGYAFRWGEVVGAWRYLEYDLPSDKAIADINFNGPALGLAFRW